MFPLLSVQARGPGTCYFLTETVFFLQILREAADKLESSILHATLPALFSRLQAQDS